jgi:hypothetical protein
MRKIIFLALLLPGLILPAFPEDQERKYAEIGFDLDAGLSNTFFTIKDLFFSGGILDINLKELQAKNVAAALNGRAEIFVNVPAVPVIDVGIFIGGDAAASGLFPSSLFRLLTNDYAGSIDSLVNFGGSLMWDTGLRLEGEFQKWKLTVSPAFYMPLLYIPWSESNIHADRNSSSFSLKSQIDVYSSEQSGVQAVGFDLSLQVYYPLLPFMGLGGGIEHIPIVPAKISDGQRWNIDYQIEAGDNPLKGGDFNADNLKPDIGASSSDSFLAFRPLRLNLYAAFRLLKNEMLLVKPTLGFSFLTIYGYDDFCFNAGVEGRVFFAKFFSAGIGSEYKEKVWKQTVRLGFSIRYAEINLGMNMEAPKFAASFSGKGMGFFASLRFGY